MCFFHRVIRLQHLRHRHQQDTSKYERETKLISVYEDMISKSSNRNHDVTDKQSCC